MANSFIDEINKATFDKYETLQAFLKNIQIRYNVNINLHDVIGVGNVSPLLGKVFMSHQYHNNHFCNFIKKNNCTFKICVGNKEKLCKQCMKNKAPFYGTCYMGVDEFVYPVFCDERLIAIICVGQFCSDSENSTKKIMDNSNLYKFDGAEAVKQFNNAIKNIDFNVKMLIEDIALLKELILLIFKNSLNENSRFNKQEAIETLDIQNGNFIISNTIKFINDNYEKDLPLKLLASNSYCNHTYLSTLFKEKLGIGIADYVTKIRIDKSKELLDITNLSITAISSSVGYNDSGYFTRVFKSIEGLTPNDYRKRNIQK